MNILNIVVLLISYLLGAIPFGLLIGKMKGIDVRQYGSGNIGTSNVARTLGKKAAIFTLLGDGLKGLIPVLFVRVVLPGDSDWMIAAGLAAIVGHNWPVYLKFKGGKGVTTTYGAFLGISWLPAILTILIWVLVSRQTKKASIAALISAPCAILFAALLWLSPFTALSSGNPFPVLLFAVITFLMIYIRHIDNIKRLLAGTELRLDQKLPTEKEEE
jgi:glycerol-3-phosphate acyltransferase PlsY